MLVQAPDTTDARKMYIVGPLQNFITVQMHFIIGFSEQSLARLSGAPDDAQNHIWNRLSAFRSQFPFTVISAGNWKPETVFKAEFHTLSAPCI
jgi:hypothetical protein